MDFGFSEERQMLRETARRFLDDKAPLDAVRLAIDTEQGFDDDLWRSIAEQGWQAMAIPEEYGGAGFGFMEQSILIEEMGRSLFPSPYLSSIVLGADLVLDAGTDDQKAALLPEVATGERRLAVAFLEADGSWEPDGITTTVTFDGDSLVLEGSKAFVIDGDSATTLLVAAREPGSTGLDGVAIVIVDTAADGVSARRVETLDQTRKQAEITCAQVRLDRGSVLGGDSGTGWEALRRTLTRAAVAVAFEQVGGAQQCLDMAVAYAKERVQFGRPIGSFQAIKHMCADMLVAVESAKSAAYYAGWAVATNSPDVDVAAAVARSFCSEAYVQCAGDSIQIHGGVGFTWEHDAHLYFKRAITDELVFGTPAEHRARLADTLGV